MGPITAFRAALLVVCLFLSLLPTPRRSALVVLALLAVATWVASRETWFARFWSYGGSLAVAAVIPFTGEASSPLLPYLLAGGLTLGLRSGLPALVFTTGSLSGVLLLGTSEVADQNEYLIASAEWVLLTLSVGAVARWARLHSASLHEEDDYVQVRNLLTQVRNLSQHLPNSLDATSAAEALLTKCALLVDHDQAAVVVQPHGGSFIPLAVRGTSRVPWRTPSEGQGPLWEAWTTCQPSQDVRLEDQVGRRRGGTVIAVPLLSSGTPFGLIVLESEDLAGFSDDVVASLRGIAAAGAARLETALLFEEVRLEAGHEERDRLARDMHDGIAQELAYVGYHLDDLRIQASRVDEQLARQVAVVRQEVTAMLSDLRLSLTDLRTGIRTERGLGAVLSDYLRALFAGRDVVLTLTLDETAFRLPADTEVMLLRAGQAFAQAARFAPGVTNLSMHLRVDPPSMSLTLVADGDPFKVRLGDLADLLEKAHAEVSTMQDELGHSQLAIMMEGRPDDYQRAPRRRPRAHQAGAAQGV